ncbi:hypothetical protein ES703_79559 [subsurface metagenome]
MTNLKLFLKLLWALLTTDVGYPQEKLGRLSPIDTFKIAYGIHYKRGTK